MKLLDGATAIGVGAIEAGHSINDLVPIQHSFQVNITGAPTAVTVAVLGSLDKDAPLTTLATHAFTAGELTAENAFFQLADTPLARVKLEVTVLTGGTAPTVTGYYVNG